MDRSLLGSRMLAAFAHRNYRYYWFGMLVSVICSWMQTTAQAWLVLEITKSGMLLGIAAACQFFPQLLLCVPAGAVIDRNKKKTVIVFAQIVMMAVALGLWIIAEYEIYSYILICMLLLLHGLAMSFDLPARHSFIVEMVGKTDLVNAISLNSVMFNISRMLGPVIAGMLIAEFGMPIVFMVNAISFLAVIFSLLRIDCVEHPAVAASNNIISAMRSAWDYLVSDYKLLLPMSTLLVFSIAAMNFNVLIPILAKQVFMLPAREFGYMMGAVGIGATLGALTMASIAHKGPRWTVMFSGGFLLSLMYILLPFTNNLFFAGALLAVIGWGSVLFLSSSNSMIQMNVPNEMRGRIMGFYGFVVTGSIPLGSLLTGSLTTVMLPKAATAVFGVLGMFVLVVSMIKLVSIKNKMTRE